MLHFHVQEVIWPFRVSYFPLGFGLVFMVFLLFMCFVFQLILLPDLFGLCCFCVEFGFVFSNPLIETARIIQKKKKILMFRLN